MIELKDLIGNIKQREEFPRVTFAPDSWSMDVLLEAIRRTGQAMDRRFVLDDDNTRFYQHLAYWLMNDPRMTCVNPDTGKAVQGRNSKGLYIAGKTGNGKTTAVQILHQIAMNSPLFLVKDDMGIGRRQDWMLARADTIATEYMTMGDIDKYRRASILCIDDLGIEPEEVIYMGNRVNVMKSLLEYRGDRNCMTIITSNIPISEIAGRYGERVQSRLIEMCNYFPLRGEDRRRIK